ncbi:MAG: choice-of-anchor Q domain-containing protein [Caldilineaceae bacterium]
MAASFTVTKPTDTNDGVCNIDCSLREAITAANNSPGPDTINVPAGVFVLTLSPTGDDNDNLSGDLDIKDSITIQGSGAGATIIDGNNQDRIFDTYQAVTGTVVSLSGMTLQNGNPTATSFTNGTNGGAIYVYAPTATQRVTLNISNSRLINNKAKAGGAIQNDGGVVTITNSEISGNQALTGNGGGLATLTTVNNQGPINITNSTISGNMADLSGGGLYLDGLGNATLTNVTIANNIADNDHNGTGTGGGLAETTTSLVLNSTLVAVNFKATRSVSSDISGVISTTSAYSLLGDGTGASGLTNGVNHNKVGTAASPINPLLDGLANKGGATQTHALLVGSPALDGGPATCAAAPVNGVDQRGISRPRAAACDIGAYELADLTPPDTTMTANPLGITNSSTAAFSFTGADDRTATGALTFECQLDNSGFSACTSPKSYTSLLSGVHTFLVRARDQEGNLDPTPVNFTWTIDQTPPTVTNVTSSTPNGAYRASAVIDIQVVFNEAVVVTGVPQLTLKIGTPNAVVNYTSTLTNTLLFRYIVATGQNSTDLDYASKTALALNGGAIKDLAGNLATIGLASPGSAGSLGANKAIVIDNVAPDTTIKSNPAASSGPTASFTFTGSDTGGSGVASFACSLDNAGFSICASPQGYTGLVAGPHVFQVRAIDNAGNSDTTPASYNWSVDVSTPSATLGPVTPDPRNTGVSSIAIVFNKAVTGFDLSDLTLTRNGVAVALTKASISGSGANYTLSGLTNLTNLAGAYILTLHASTAGIKDTVGNPLTNDASTSFVVDTVLPTADIIDVAPDPRNSVVNTVVISFSEAVTGVDLSDFSLTRSGTAVPLTGASVTGNGANYTLDNLSALTSASGAYLLTLKATNSGIIDTAGNSLAGSVSDSFTVDTVAPTVDIVDVTPDPRNTGVTSITLLFSKPVVNFDLADLTLTRNGAPVALTGALLNGTGATYKLENLAGLTTPDGAYVLTLNAASSGITDAIGNALAGDGSDSFVVDANALIATLTPVTPDPRNIPVNSIDIVFSKAVSGFGLSDLRLQHNGSANLLTGLQTLTTSDNRTWTLGNLASLTSTSGNYTLTLTAAGSGIIDAANNPLAGAASESWVIDMVAPATILDDQPANPSNSRRASFAFHATKPGSTYACRLDSAGFTPCTSPVVYNDLADGNHTFQVQATDALGNVDKTPVTYTWAVQPGVLIGSCDGYTVTQTVQGQYFADGWTGVIIVGTEQDDTLTGDNSANLILGLGGNDTIHGEGGDDVICGGAGDDKLFGEDGHDLLDGGDGNDKAYGGPGDDRLLGGAGDDKLYGHEGNDVLDGGAGNDQLDGDEGDFDQLIGGDGNDVLYDKDGVTAAQGGTGDDKMTITLRNGWRDAQGQPRFDGLLSGGYQNDSIILRLRDQNLFVVNLTGDERDNPASPQEGNNDQLDLRGNVDPSSQNIKFELMSLRTTGVDDPTIIDDAPDDESEGDVQPQSPPNTIFLPVVVR